MEGGCEVLDLEKHRQKGNIKTARKIFEINTQLKSAVSSRVMDALADINTSSEEAYAVIPTLVSLTSHADPEIRMTVVQKLATLDFDDKIIVYAIKRCLQDKNAKVRKHAVKMLGTLGPRAAQAVFDLADRALNDTDPDVQRLSCHALGEIGPTSSAALPALVQLLRHSEEDLRLVAVQTLNILGDDSEMAMPALIQALKDQSTRVRKYAALTLNQLGAVI